jgi:hypothetical protein
LRKKYGTPDEPPKPAVDPKKAISPSPAPPKAGSSQDDKGGEGVPTAHAPDPAAEDAPPAGVATVDAKGKRISPWELVDQFKERATKAEQRALELEKQVVPEAKVKESAERMTAYEKRIEEMQSDLRYYNAEKYDPDILKANADYEGAWKRAMGELKELQVTDPQTNATRPLQVDDIIELVGLSLPQAREIADKVFGIFADDVMHHRKEIKTLFEAKSAKLEELKKSGADRDRLRSEASQKEMGELKSFVQQTYEAAVSEAVKHEQHGVYLRPKEGDNDWNAKLEKATAFVDGAFTRSVTDSKLSPKDRAELVRQQAAVRNRAIAYSPMKHHIASLEKKLSAALEELKQYQETEPATAGRNGNGSPEAPRGMSGVHAALQKLAK